jgi:hypothetical protein
METWLKCKVSPGQFSVEYAVQARDFEGKGFSLFAPTETVEVEQFPNENESVEGWMCVKTEAQEGDLVLIQLPKQVLGHGYYVTVLSNQLETRSARQEA